MQIILLVLLFFLWCFLYLKSAFSHIKGGSLIWIYAYTFVSSIFIGIAIMAVATIIETEEAKHQEYELVKEPMYRLKKVK